MAWLVLFCAGLLEVVWAIGLKYSEGFTRLGPSIVTVTAMAVNFYLPAQVFKTIPMGTGYAVWTGIGAVGTALAGIFLFGENRNPAQLVCLVLIISGIIGLKFVSPE